jgi:hypothetical protein
MPSLVALNRANQAIRDAEAAARMASDWYRASAYATKRDQEARDAARRSALEKMEAVHLARWHAKKAAEQAATAGRGWRILEAPRVAHAELDALVRRTWDLAMHGAPFLSGWRAAWADLSAANAAGMCVMGKKLILLDEAAQRGRSWRAFLTTVVHEICHAVHPDEVHGEGFAETLRRMLGYVLADETELTPAWTEPAGAARPHPEPRKGAMFSGSPVPWSGAGEWEFR